MPRRFHVALYGFTEPERKALDAAFREAAGDTAYDIVASLDDADCIVAEADEPHIVDGVHEAGRIADTLYVGASAPESAGARIDGPLDAARVIASLDRLMSRPPAAVPELTLIVEPPELDDRVEPGGFRPYADSGARGTPVPSLEPVKDRRSSKSEARAAVRRARMAHAPADVVQCPDVLVLDDSEIARVFLSKLLRIFGFQPHAVATSDQALDLLEKQPFAATFLDVVLGAHDSADGLALCQRIKSAPVRPGLTPPVVVMVSGQARPSDRVRAQLAGCDGFLGKPLSRGDVARALENCGVPFPADERRR